MLIGCLLGVITAGALLWGPIVSNVEQAKYTVVEQHGNIELRDYDPMIIAEVDVSGTREESIEAGFRVIADYIFGNNLSTKKIAMTAPVIQQQSEKIAMTAPVIQQADGSKWKVRFVMPANYSLQTLPKPNNLSVRLKEVPGQSFAAIRFSGFSEEENLRKNTEELNGFIKQKKLKGIASPIYAFYNPPWTLPFFRRNEVLIEVKR